RLCEVLIRYDYRLMKRALLALPLAAALLASCRSAPDVTKVMPAAIQPYRMTVQQGNFISSDAITQLKPGMTKEQVRFRLGTPLVTDIFHADRWDYVFTLEVPNKKREQRNLSVYFEDGKLTRLVGDLLPSESEVKAAAQRAAAEKEAE